MIKAEAKENGKVCTLIRGDADSVFQEFFRLLTTSQNCVCTRARREIAKSLRKL